MSHNATPAPHALERAGIKWVTHEYRNVEHGKALSAAEQLGVEPERVFKTLIVEAEGHLYVCCVPATERLSLKLAAQAHKVKRPVMADAHRAERSTGYVTGGISPIAQRIALPTAIDETAQLFATVFVSSGRRGHNVELAPADLLRVTRGFYAPLTA